MFVTLVYCGLDDFCAWFRLFRLIVCCWLYYCGLYCWLRDVVLVVYVCDLRLTCYTVYRFCWLSLWVRFWFGYSWFGWFCGSCFGFVFLVFCCYLLGIGLIVLFALLLCCICIVECDCLTCGWHWLLHVLVGIGLFGLTSWRI